MTAGWSKGKNAYYLYYRCIKHSNINIPGTLLHDKFEELLKYLSFSQEFLDKLISRVTMLAKGTLNISEQRKKILDGQLKAIDLKIEGVEEKLFEGIIVDHTYKRWMVKFQSEKANLMEAYRFSETLEDTLHQELLLMPYLLNLPQVYKDSSLGQNQLYVN